MGNNEVPRPQPSTPLNSHVLYFHRIVLIMCDMISNRLFNVVREKLGLTYDISFSSTCPELYDGGMLLLSTSPFPDKIEEIVEESLKILKSFLDGNFTQEELDEVLRN